MTLEVNQLDNYETQSCYDITAIQCFYNTGHWLNGNKKVIVNENELTSCAKWLTVTRTQHSISISNCSEITQAGDQVREKMTSREKSYTDKT